MTVDLEPLFNSREQALIIVDLQVRMNTALHENSRPAQRQRFLDFLIDHVIRQNIRLWIAFDSIERAERTELFAHIRVVNIAIDDIADDIIRVNALAPGFVETALTKRALSNPGIHKALLYRTLLKRFGTAEDMANAVLFLASDDASYITGAVLAVDGGMSAGL